MNLANPVIWRRVMVVAPHPDDESIAAGGLLARAVTRGAIVRLVCLTDGESNPWPQRFFLRRWRITEADRARWGALRRAEVFAAVGCLGVPEDAVQFLGLPDQGLTRLMLRGEDPLGGLVADFRPTLLVTPAVQDLHPDHSATALLAARALAMLERRAQPLSLGYVVHGTPKDFERMPLALTTEERRRKRDAVLCHESQLVLSRRRFLAHVKDSECFTDQPFAESAKHPVLDAVAEDGVLRLRLAPRLRPFRRETLVLVTSDAPGSPGVRCAVHVGSNGEATVPIDALLPAARIFVKLEQRWPFLIFDRAGWRPALFHGATAGAWAGSSDADTLEAR
jgi:LmbE family N-acetylglucosaminyl deacetylase